MRPRLDNTYHGKPCKLGHTLRRIGGTCVECNRAQSRAYVKANPTQNAEWCREKRRSGRNYDPAKAQAEKEATIQLQRRKQMARIWTQRQERLGAPGEGVTAGQWDRMVRDSCGLCAYCGQAKPLTLDHIDPLSRGGEHGPDNAVAACWECNRSKHATPLLLWLVQRRARRQRAAA